MNTLLNVIAWALFAIASVVSPIPTASTPAIEVVVVDNVKPEIYGDYTDFGGSTFWIHGHIVDDDRDTCTVTVYDGQWLYPVMTDQYGNFGFWLSVPAQYRDDVYVRVFDAEGLSDIDFIPLPF